MLKKHIYHILQELDRPTLMTIAIISILGSALSLIVPIAAQTLVNLVAFGKLFQPVITLSIMVLVLMVAIGALSIWQFIIIEIIQQKMMVKTSLNLAKHFNRLSLENFSSHHGPALVNRYFDIIIVQKAVGSILMYGIYLALQVFFGMILLLLYHPFFLVFNAFILIGLLLSIMLPYHTAMFTAKEECSRKHAIGAWLEEILINRTLFKFDDYHRYLMQQTDKELARFLQVRNKHVKQLIKHHIGFYTLSALASSLLLLLGGYLVIQNQLSLGQLVAAEVILGALLYAFRRFGALLENFYELMASAGKLESALQLPLEAEQSHALTHVLTPPYQTFEIIINQIAVAAAPNQPVLFSTNKQEKSQAFVTALFGFKKSDFLTLKINHIPCNETELIGLRRHSHLIGKPQWFSGSIYANLTMNHGQFSLEKIFYYLKQLELIEAVMNLPDGIHTVVHDWQTDFTHQQLIKLMVVRALITRPSLLVFDRALDDFYFEEIKQILALILEIDKAIILVTSLRSDVQSLFARVVSLP